MGIFEAGILAFGIGFGLYFGLATLGEHIKAGMVEAAKMSKCSDAQTPSA